MVGRRGHHVGDQHLLAEADDEILHAQADLLHGHAADLQFLRDVGVADDRPGDEMREHHDVGRQPHRAALRRHLPAPHIDQVRHELEREERDAEREREFELRQRPPGQAAQIGQEEAGIFEDPQHRQIEDHETGQHPLPPLRRCVLDPSRAAIVQAHESRKKEHVAPLPPGVENQASGQQRRVARAGQIIEGQEDRQEVENEDDRTEDHGAPRPASAFSIAPPGWPAAGRPPCRGEAGRVCPRPNG